MAKFINVMMWVLVGIVLLAVLWWFVISPIIGYVGSDYSLESEMRLYVRLFILMFVLSTFGILRLYNSIVTNTRFSIKLREAMLKFVSAAPGLERAMKNLNSSLGNVKSSADTLKKSLDGNTESVDEFMKKIDKLSKVEKSK